MDRKGTLFVPSFSVERSQEIACVLKNANFKHRIIMDGMALKVNEIIMRHPEYLKEPEIFKDVLDKVVAIHEHGQRKKALSEPCVVISPAGMLVGGNAVYYLQKLAFDDKNGIALVSYQGKGKEMHVAAQVKQFQFSGHADRDSLFDMIKNIKGNPKVLTVHGDNNSCIKFAEEIHEKFGLDAIAPKIDDTISI